MVPCISLERKSQTKHLLLLRYLVARFTKYFTLLTGDCCRAGKQLSQPSRHTTCPLKGHCCVNLTTPNNLAAMHIYWARTKFRRNSFFSAEIQNLARAAKERLSGGRGVGERAAIIVLYLSFVFASSYLWYYVNSVVLLH